MLYKVFSFLSLILLGDVVNCQPYVTLVTDTDVLYQKESLLFKCSPNGVAAQSSTITAIILLKNSTSGWKQIVKIWLNDGNDGYTTDITWNNADIMSRANIINQKIRPSNEAGLWIEISPNKTRCSDSGEYKCYIGGNSDAISLGSNSTPKTVEMRVEPASINPISVQPQRSDNTYNPYESVRLTCNGDVGNPVRSNLRWCIRTTDSNMMSDFTIYYNTNDITHGTPILSGCQYRQQSVLTYNISATIPQADFRCETGGTSTICGHSSAIAANYTIYRFTDKSKTGGQGGPETSNGGVIAGAVIGSFVGIVLIIIIIYFVAFRKKNTGETYRTKEENGTGNVPIDNTVYSIPHKDKNRNDRNSPGHYENKGMDEPHTRGHLPNMDPRGRSNRGMDRSVDDVRDNNVMSSRGPIMGSNASFGSAV